MRIGSWKTLGFASLAAVLAFSTPVLYGQPEGTPPRTIESVAAPQPASKTLAGIAGQIPVLPPCAIPDDLNDAAFARYADLLLLGQAWDSHDAAMLTDVALQLAEGERVLLRPHKAIDTGMLFEIAARVAGDRNDKATLDRLDKAAHARGSQQLAKSIEDARKGAESYDEHELSVGHPIEDLTPEALVLHQVVIRRIRTATLAGDGTILDKLDKYLDQFKELHPGQQVHFDKLIARAKSALPKQSKLAPTVKVLERLGALTPCVKAG